MKKRVLSLLLVVALLASLAVFPVSAADDGTYCPHCEKTVPASEWQPWTGAADPASGHYRLEGDLLKEGIKAHTNMANGGNKDADVVLDLNGYTWRCDGDYVASVGVTTCTLKFSIMDSVGGGEIQGTGQNGGSFGVLRVTNGATLNIYGGTLRQIVKPGISIVDVGVLYVNGAICNMYGGTITDGYNINTTKPSAGNVLVRGDATFTMYDGEIVNGYTALYGAGVNVYYNSNTCKFIMNGGRIANNVAEDVAGNIYNTGLLEINGPDAVVENGVAAGRATVMMSSAHVGRGANIFNANLMTLNGVEGVKGDIYSYTTTAGNTTLKGTVKIPMGNSTGLQIRTNQKINIDNLNTDSKIYVDTANVGGDGTTHTFTTENANIKNWLDAGCFVGANHTSTIAQTEGANSLTMTKGNTGYCLHCNQEVTWIGLTDLSDKDKANLAAGHYYMTANLTTGSRILINDDTVLDLYGKNLNISTSAINMHGSLNIMDTLGGGKITGGRGDKGGLVFTEVTGTTLTLYSGNMIRTATTATNAAGGVLGLNGVNFNMRGGVIADGKTKSNGGNISMTGTCAFNMTGGLITGGQANTSGKMGGNVYTSSTVTTSITGGRIMNGSSASHGGNLYLGENANTINAQVKNVVIMNGTSTAGNGGNVASYSKGIQTFNNVTLVGGSASGYGGNLYLSGSKDATVSNCAIYDGQTAANSGGNLFLRENVVNALLENVDVYNGKCETNLAEKNDRADNVYAGAHTTTLDAVHIYGNAGLNEMGSGVMARSTSKNVNIILKGNTTIGSTSDGLNGSLYFKNYDNGETGEKHVFTTPVLNVDSSFSGLVVLNGYNLIEEGYREEPYGQTLINTAADIPAFSGKLYMGDHKTAGLEVWKICMPEITNVGGKLKVATGAVLENAESKTFYPEVANAVTNYKENDILSVYTEEPVLNLDAGIYYINVAGNHATVNGTGVTVYGIDSMTYNHANTLTGSLAAGEGVTVKAAATDADGEVYIRTVDETTNNYEFHHISMDIKSVVLRTNTAGVYYKGAWTCDNELAKHLNAEGNNYEAGHEYVDPKTSEATEIPNVIFGIVASTQDMPGTDFTTEVNTEGKHVNSWSFNAGAGFTSGDRYSGALVSGFMKETNSNTINAENCEIPVYAKAYLMVTDTDADGNPTMTYIVGKDGADKSLMDIFVQLDKVVTEDHDANTNNIALMTGFYEKWAGAGLRDAVVAESEREDGYIFNTIFEKIETGSSTES